MILSDFPAEPRHSEFIQCYRIVHFTFPGNEIPPYKLYPPKPENCLHFCLTDPFSLAAHDGTFNTMPPVMFNGQQTKSSLRYTGYELYDVQVVFQPTAVYRLTGVPATELTDQYIEGAFLFSKKVYSVLHQMQDLRDYTAVLTILKNFVDELIKEPKKDKVLLDTVIRAQHSSYEHSVDSWAAQSYVGLKQFERLFYQRAGVNPKLYSRIVRFNKVYNFRNRFPNRTWLSLAMEFNYHDYQHLVRDYKYFTGYRPNELHAWEKRSPEAVLGLAGEVYKRRAK